MIKNKIGVFSAMGISIGAVIGSGWLFAPYYAAQAAGSASLISWVIVAVLMLVMGLLLSELATMFPRRGLFTRLLSMSHNKDFGFVTALSNWFGTIVVIPSEAEATIQYLSTVYKPLMPKIFSNGSLSLLGLVFVAALVLVYTVLNFWGARVMSRFNNLFVSFKILIPTVTVILMLIAAFHAGNFTAYEGKVVPYGFGSIFGAIVSCGIFYAFYGFQMAVSFAAEIENPGRNIPIAMGGAILLCTILYLLLQTAFIGALPTGMLAHGWHHLDFTAPLVQLVGLLGLNAWLVVLYADSCVSPSATGMVYMGASTRMLTAMSQEKQMPKFFDRVLQPHNFSRRSLIATYFFCLILIVFFRSWQSLVELISLFQMVCCVGIPLALFKYRLTDPDHARPFRMPFGKTLSVILFVVLTLLLLTATLKALTVFFWVQLGAFLVYGVISAGGRLTAMINTLRNAGSMFAFLLFLWLARLAQNHWYGTATPNIDFYAIVIVIALGLFFWMLNQGKRTV